MLIRAVLLLSLALFHAHSVCASISSVTLNDGAFSLFGDSFGEKSLMVEWVGSNIEAGVMGQEFSKTKWTVDETEAWSQAPIYTDTNAHSGTKSILCELPIETQYTSAFTYDHGSRFDEIYVSYWVYFDHVDSAAQWKQWRLRPVDAYGDVNGEIMSSQWYGADGTNTQNYVYLFCNTANYEQCYPGGVSDLYGDDSDLIPINTWVRVDIHAIGSSVDGASDGSLIFSFQVAGQAKHIVRQYESNIVTRLSGSEKWQYFAFVNYWGNVSAGTGTNEKFYFDDIFIQTGSQARVEIGDNAVFANCTHIEIQPALTWSDTGITGTFNQGSFETGDTVYFFVIDENGVPSDGYAVVIGGETPMANPIVNILTESGQTTTASIFEITGTVTADTDQTISGVTCDGQTVIPDDGTWDEQSEAFTCLASLALGENTLVFIGSDGTRTGHDSITVTRIKKTSKMNGSATIKNATIHQ